MPLPCPSCTEPAAEHTLPGHHGTTVIIDICRRCQAIWFDGHESLRLSPGGTLQLFRLIGEAAASAPQPAVATLRCPRCSLRLRPVEDRQRTTRFRYHRCPQGHGRLITFYDFLREKDFIRPLSADQIAQLRAHVQTINCSNCGAPVDLAHESRCGHCRSPLSMLDLGHATALVEQLRASEAPKAVDPALPLELLRARLDAAQALDRLATADAWYVDVPSEGLLGAGLRALARWIARL